MQRNPVDFLRFVANHYQLLVALSDQHRGFQSDDEITAFIRSHSNVSNTSKIASQMKRLGILNQCTGQWALPPFLSSFLASLQERHILATPGVVRAWVERLTGLASSLDRVVTRLEAEQSTLDGEFGRSLLQDISDAIHVVSMTISDNIERIGQEVTAYRNTEDAAVMRFRLRQLIDLYENYLLPVMNTLDTTGPFQAVSQQILTLCTQIESREQSIGFALADDARHLRQQVAWLRRTILRQADEANAELAPLCMAVSRESAIARGVNRAIQSIQEGKWKPLGLDEMMQIVNDQDSSLAGDDAISGFMQDAFKLRQQSPPRITPEEPDLLKVPISAATLRERLEEIEQVDDVLIWINEGNDETLNVDKTVNLLFQLIDMERDRFQSDGRVLIYEFEQVSVETCKWTWSQSNER